MMQTGSVYGLKAPDDDRIRYVGKTVNPLAHRMRAHMKEINGRSFRSAKISWIRSLDAKGIRPDIVELERVIDGDLDGAEIRWITELKLTGHLLNHTAGGTGGACDPVILKAAIDRDRSGPISCLECRREFKSSYGLRSHRGAMHSGGGKTKSDRMKQAYADGTRPRPIMKSHCPNGHEYPKDRPPKWACRPCAKEKMAAKYAAGYVVPSRQP